jgi:O-antigen/teichoic acid export membrane protein
MKILLSIVNFGNSNQQYLNRMLDEYRSMDSFDIDIVVHSNISKALGPDVEVIVGLPTKNPWTLPFAHKKTFAERRNQYDLYIYVEDDIRLTQQHIEAYLWASSVLSEDCICGFTRFELTDTGERSYADVHSFYRWDPSSVIHREGETFATLTNEHSALYILSKNQLNRAIDSGGYLLPPNQRNNYGLPETAATDPYTVCGFQKVICISRFNEFCLHHLPNKYIGKLGRLESELRPMLQTLMEVPEGQIVTSLQGCAYVNPLRNLWNKSDAEIANAVPTAAKFILSVNCTLGTTEQTLVESGKAVTIVPMDSLFTAACASRSLETTPSNLADALSTLEGRLFDCIILNDFPSETGDPEEIQYFLPLLAAEGTVLSIRSIRRHTLNYKILNKVWGKGNNADLHIRILRFFKERRRANEIRSQQKWQLSEAGLRPIKILSGKAPSVPVEIHSQKQDKSIVLAQRNNKATRSVAWAYIMNWIQQGGSAVFTLILAAILGPTEYGIVSMAIVFTAFLDMFLDQGLVTALIQRKSLRSSHANSVFWLMIATSILLMAGTYFTSDWWAQLNDLPELAVVINIIALRIPVGALSRVQQSLMHRESNFRLLTARDTFSVLSSGIIGIAMALAGAGIWALVAQQLLKEVFNSVFLWIKCPWRPQFHFSKKAAKELLGFSSANFLAKLGDFISGNAAAVLIGIFLGPYAVGLYRFATRLVDLLLQVLTRSIQVFSLPELSRVQNDAPVFAEKLRGFIRASTLITIPPLVLMASVGSTAMLIIGEKWLPAVPIMQVLCIGGAIESICQFTSPMLQALSRTLYLAAIAWTSSILNLAMVGSISILLQDKPESEQILGLALGKVTIAACFSLPVILFSLKKFTLLGISRTLLTTLPAVLVSIGGLALGRVLNTYVGPSIDNNLLRLIVIGSINFTAMGAGLYAFNEYTRTTLHEGIAVAMRKWNERKTKKTNYV